MRCVCMPSCGYICSYICGCQIKQVRLGNQCDCTHLFGCGFGSRMLIESKETQLLRPKGWLLRVGSFCPLAVSFPLNIRGNMERMPCCKLINCDNLESLICTAIYKLKIELWIWLFVCFFFWSSLQTAALRSRQPCFASRDRACLSENVISQDLA